MQFLALLRRWLPGFPPIAGAVAVLLGLWVLAGWLTGHYLWVQIRPEYAPVQGNTAVCLILVGAALIAAHLGLPRLAFFLSLALGLLAGAVFAQYLLRVDLGLDELLFPHPVTAQTTVAGRMPPNTTVAFLLCAASIMLVPRVRFAGALLGSVVFSIGSVALAGYLTDVPAAFAWGGSTHMALLTSIGFTTLGVGLLAYAFESQRRDHVSRRPWAPLLVGLTAALFGIFFWQALRIQEHDQIRRTVNATVRGVAGEIEARIQSMVTALSRLAIHGEAVGWNTREEWRTDARLTVGAFPGFETIEWIDEDFRPRIVATRTEEPRVLTPTPGDRVLLSAALDLARSSAEPVVAGPFRFANGEHAFRVIVPVARPSRGVGAYVAAVFSVVETFAELSARLTPGFATDLYCEDQQVFRQGPPDVELAAGWSREVGLALPGPLQWKVRLTPSTAALARQRSGLPELALTASLLIAVLLGLTVRFGAIATQRAERFELAVTERTAELERALARLEWENSERRRTEYTLRRTQAVSRFVSGELDLQKVVQAVTDAATALTGAEAGAFFYNATDEQGESYRLYALSGVPAEAFDGIPMPRSTELFGPTFRGEQVIRIDDVKQDPRYGKNPPHEGLPIGHPIDITSYLAVPVLSRSGEVWGGLLFGHSKRGVFTEREEEIAVGLAAQASIAMDNARLYEAERAAKAEAQTANAAKDHFMAMLGHELRNPLGSIRNAYEVLKLQASDDGVRERMLTITERQLSHLTRLVDDLLDISRVERGKVALQPERIDLVALVRDLVESQRPRVEAANISLEVDLPEDVLWVDGDPTRLTQVVDNLISNATKFTDAGGTIHVDIRSEKDDAVLHVRDTGAGIPPDQIDYIFEPFAQTDQSLDRSTGGLGLGLPIVRGLVEAHGGTVLARSAGPGSGSEFTVRLPLAEAPIATIPKVATREEEQSMHILVIDDHVDSAEGLAELLSLLGHQVDVAHSGPEGLQAARELGPELVICDIGLPEMDGYEVAKELRADPRTAGIHLFALSGYGDDEAARRADEAGFDCHLTKPINAATLSRLVARVPVGMAKQA